jgi:hypothetical protein
MLKLSLDAAGPSSEDIRQDVPIAMFRHSLQGNISAISRLLCKCVVTCQPVQTLLVVPDG